MISVIKTLVSVSIFAMSFLEKDIASAQGANSNQLINFYVSQTNMHGEFYFEIFAMRRKVPSYAPPLFPIYAGVISISDKGMVTFLSKSELAQIGLEVVAQTINDNCRVYLDERSSLVVPSDKTRATGHLFRRSIGCKEPEFVDGVISYLEDLSDYKILRTTRDVPPDPDWMPSDEILHQK